MPFVTIDLLRGKPPEYLEAVSEAVHEALVEGLGMFPDDRFQVINQLAPGELVFSRDFRGGPRSDDFMVFTITDGLDRGEKAKQAFYRALTRNLSENPGVRPADVFVKMHVTPPVNFSFADGVPATETTAREALDRAAAVPGTRDAYTRTEMVEAITRMFRDNDRGRIVSMLRDHFVLKMPTSMPYGGEFRGAKEFDDYFKRVVEQGNGYYETFVTSLRRLIEADDHLIAEISITAKGRTTQQSMDIENAWVFDIAGGNFVSAQIYADTATGMKTAG
ncbi:tautomerase family protein [Streptosporangium lutulentum]|uniref:Phenylpyruvate tautomerase PptA (4-oxalocrotonate tautomerase family) n=1 Tax=Streptosporangium lutulentum TaxID=1461250 RepID=A0ABT9Q950_9ACTN|nr:tautomerase family protein [Streptosporangium lutulentum]MDP9842930.1 phenylpyruvate tautomerase PptA (4-oxalocrotonate tautomerase family) [Streptosporangium lutulentum]